MNRETPSIAAMASASSTYAGLDTFLTGDTQTIGHVAWDPGRDLAAREVARRIGAAQHNLQAQTIQAQLPKKEMPVSTRRMVQVFIADTNENIPLDDMLLYRGDQHLTDLNDQELFFEIDIKALLSAHNAKRTKIVDKKVKDRTEYLEPVKIRDLKMTVVTVASF